MLASSSSKRPLAGRVLLVMLTAGLAACNSRPEVDRPGTWKATGVNDQNLRAMLVTPQDAYVGTGETTSRANVGARAVTRLLTDRRRPLMDTSLTRVGGGGGSSGGGDAGPAPTAGASSP